MIHEYGKLLWQKVGFFYLRHQIWILRSHHFSTADALCVCLSVAIEDFERGRRNAMRVMRLRRRLAFLGTAQV